MDWRSSCCSRIARPTSATNGAASSGCDASEVGSFVFANAPHTCQSVRTWDQDVKQLGRTGCNGGYCTTTNDTPKGRTAQSGKKEHPSTGLRRLRPEEGCSGPGRCRNGRKRSGPDRCARFGPGASASDPTLCGSSGGAEPNRLPAGIQPLANWRPTGGSSAVNQLPTLHSWLERRTQTGIHQLVVPWRTWLKRCPAPFGLPRRGASFRWARLGGSRRSSSRRSLRRFATPRPASGAGEALWG